MEGLARTGWPLCRSPAEAGLPKKGRALVALCFRLSPLLFHLLPPHRFRSHAGCMVHSGSELSSRTLPIALSSMRADPFSASDLAVVGRGEAAISSRNECSEEVKALGPGVGVRRSNTRSCWKPPRSARFCVRPLRVHIVALQSARCSRRPAPAPSSRFLRLAPLQDRHWDSLRLFGAAASYRRPRAAHRRSASGECDRAAARPLRGRSLRGEAAERPLAMRRGVGGGGVWPSRGLSAPCLPIPLAKSRAGLDTEELSHEGCVALRSLVYKFNWVARETRPDVAWVALILAHLLAKSTIQEIKTANKVARYLRSAASQGISVSRIPISDLSLISVSDSGGWSG